MIYFFDINLKLKKIVNPDNALSAIHEHELNNHIIGSMVMDMAYAKTFIDDVDHFGYYYKGNFYLHRIRRVEDSHISETVTVTGRHIFFEDMLYGLPIDDFRPQNRDAAYILKNTIDTNTRWRTVMTDVTGTLSTNFYRQVPWDVIEWVTENFRVEFEPVILFDGQKINGYQLHVANKLGVNKHKRIPFSRVTELDYEIDYSEIITSLAGYGKGEEVGEGYGRRINIADVDFSRNGVVSPIGSHYMEDANITAIYGKDNGEPKYGIVEFSDIEDDELLAEAIYESYLEMSRPKMAFSASVIDVGDVGIGDTQVIVRPESNIFYSVRIHKLSANLHDPEDADVELGDYEHFKESKVERKSRQADKAWKKRYASAIEQMKRDWTSDYEGVIEQIEQGYEQAVIDANANIQAAEVRMQTEIDNARAEFATGFDDAVAEAEQNAQTHYNTINQRITTEIDTTRTEMTEDFNTAVQGAKEYAETQATEKASAVQSNLESFEQTHQQLYDSVTSDIMDIDTFLGDKSQTLAQQFADVESDFSGLQTELNGVSTDLGATKTELQQQLDDAKASIEGIEVGGRNLLVDEALLNWQTPYIRNGYTFRLTPTNFESGIRIRSEDILEPREKYVLSFKIKKISGVISRLGGHVPLDLRKNESVRLNGIVAEGSWYSGFPVDLLDGEVLDVQINFETDTDELFTLHDYYIQLNRNDFNHDYVAEIYDLQIEQGTVKTSWEPPLEDTEQKITTLNQEIEFIEGELSAKIEQTDIEPINNKITEYGNTLTANAQSIQSLLDKTELHDGDISKWSNETTANAESITTALSRISKTESGLSSAQTDIGINADGISGLVTDLSTVDGKLSSLTTDFNIEAGRIDALVTETDGMESTLAQLVIDVDGIETTVARHNGDMLEGFSNVDQRFDSITNTVANINTWHYNLLRGTRFDENRWDAVYGEIRTDEDVNYYNFDPNATTANAPYVISNEPYYFQQGESYTLSWDFQSYGVSVFDNIWLMATAEDGGGNISIYHSANHDESDLTVFLGSEYRRYWIRFTPSRDIEANVRIGVNLANNPNGRSRFKLRLPYLTTTDRSQWLFHQLDNSQNMDEVINRVSTIEQLAESIRLDVQEISGEYVKQSGVYVGATGVQIGSTYIGDSEFASIFKVSPKTIDVVTEEMRLTGDLYVDGDIESLAVSAVTADFAHIFANTADIDFIKGKHIDVDTITVDHLYGADAILNYLMARQIFSEEVTTVSLNAIEANIGRVRTAFLTSDIITATHINMTTTLVDKMFAHSARIDELVTKTHFVDNIKAMTIEAVYGDIRSLTSEIFTSNIIKSNWLNVDTALFDRFTADEAFIDRLVVKAANIRDLEAITIDAVQANLTTVMNSMGEVEGGLTIRRIDGATSVLNGMERFGHPVPIVRYVADNVETDDKTYWTRSRTPQSVGIAYGDHAGRYYNLVVGVGLRWDSDFIKQYIRVRITPQNVPSGVTLPVVNERFEVDRNEGLQWHTLNLRMPPPTYGAISFIIEFYREGDDVYAPVEMRYGRSWVSA